MTDRELMQMALDALNLVTDLTTHDDELYEAIDAISARLAQPEPEPVAHLWECLGRWSAMIAHDGEHADLSPPSWLCDAIKAATAPPQREWQGLTDEEVFAALVSIDGNTKRLAPGFVAFYCAIEAKLKDKNP